MVEGGEVPHPGSVEARKLGCACAVMDNHYGKGFMLNGKRVWWVNENCRLHGKEARSERDPQPQR